MRVLAKLGGADALQAVKADLKNTDTSVQDAAVRALADWPDLEAAQILLDIAGKTESRTHQVLTMRGFVRLVEGAEIADDKKVEMLAAGMQVAQRPDEKRLCLSGLSKIKTVGALNLAAEFFGDADLGKEAQLAAVAIAVGDGKKNKGLRKKDAVPALEKLRAATTSAKVKARVEAQLKSIK
jgi:hypothetical protein